MKENISVGRVDRQSSFLFLPRIRNLVFSLPTKIAALNQKTLVQRNPIVMHGIMSTDFFSI